MSLQKAPASGSGYLPFGAPEARSKACSAEGGGGGPFEGGAPKEPEQAYSVPVPSSANTPKTPCMPSVPGWIQASAVAAPGAARQMVRACTLPMITLPSCSEVRLSGVMFSPGITISAGGAEGVAATGAAASAEAASSLRAQPAAASATSTATEIPVAFIFISLRRAAQRGAV
jgi:hypothetical protein